MPASPRKQLNIRSDEARALAAALSAETGLTVTQVVEMALREFRGRRRIPSLKVTPTEADRNRLALMAAVEEATPAPPRLAAPAPKANPQAALPHDRP